MPTLNTQNFQSQPIHKPNSLNHNNFNKNRFTMIKGKIFQKCYQLPITARPIRDCNAKEPNSLWLMEGENDGMMPNGKPFLSREICWNLSALLALAPSRGMGSPEIALHTPSMDWGVEMLRSQNVASIAVLKFAIPPAALCCRKVAGFGWFDWKEGLARFLI